MITFHASYFDGKSSKASPATVAFTGTSLYVRLDHSTVSFSAPVRDCVIMPSLGNTSRTITLPDGAQIETGDLAAVAGLERYAGRNLAMRLVSALETRWKAVAAALAGLVIFLWAFYSIGIPFLAKKIAYSVPSPIAETVSRQTVKLLDQQLMRPTELPEKKRDELHRIFIRLAKSKDQGIDYRLEFRKSPHLGPNAIALPSGIIVVTDELVQLSENSRELEGVLLHEMAHVEQRHGLRSVIQNAGAFVIVSILVGDVTSITSLAASLPTLLAQSGYSREFERAADKSAALSFIQKGWSTKPMQDMLVRIAEDAPRFPGQSVLSTHPMTEERVRYLQEIEKAAAKGRSDGRS